MKLATLVWIALLALVAAWAATTHGWRGGRLLIQLLATLLPLAIFMALVWKGPMREVALAMSWGFLAIVSWDVILNFPGNWTPGRLVLILWVWALGLLAFAGIRLGYQRFFAKEHAL
jgi:hypothetical protein